MTFPSFLRALNARNYRLFFTGQAVSLIGSWMTTTASAWLAYDLTRNPFFAGLLPFANQIPLLLLAPAAGVLGDRARRHGLIIRLQVLCALPSLALAAAAFTGHLSLTLLLVLSAARGVINAFEFPVRQSFLVELVGDKANLPNAIALNSSMFNVARMIGPTVAGLILVISGPAACYALDVVSFIPIVTCLLFVRTPRRTLPPGTRRRDELRAGLRYARQTPGLRVPLLMVPLIALAGFATSVLAPVFARDVFPGDARLLGNMYSAIGAGALTSAIYLSMRASPEGLAAWVVRGALLVASGQVACAASNWLPVTMAGLVANGMGAVLVMAGCNTLIQARVEDDKRSRIMGLFSMGQGVFPVGSLLIGSAAALLGPRAAVFGCAAVCSAAAWCFHRARKSFIEPPVPPMPAPELPAAG